MSDIRNILNDSVSHALLTKNTLTVTDELALVRQVSDRLTHHVHILEMNGESYRLRQSKARQRRKLQPSEPAPVAEPNENNGV